MSAFETRLNVQNVAVGTLEDERGRKTQAEIALLVAAQFPVGPDQVMALPIGSYRFALDKRSVSGFIKELQKIEADLEERADIQIASNLNGITDGRS